MATRGEMIAAALDTLLQSCADLEGAAVVSSDGLPMASALPVQFEEDRLAAMSAALLSLGERATELLGRGKLCQMFVEGEAGFVYLMEAGPAAVLCAVSRQASKSGLVIYEMRQTAQTIAGALATPPQPGAGSVVAPVPTPIPPIHRPSQMTASEAPASAADLRSVQAPAGMTAGRPAPASEVN
jgi:predicted regulator of Ras-like GTPase activity (Roadblock/LC7/MglB family)